MIAVNNFSELTRGGYRFKRIGGTVLKLLAIKTSNISL